MAGIGCKGNEMSAVCSCSYHNGNEVFDIKARAGMTARSCLCGKDDIN